jgi:hypothetical protein
MARQWRRLDSIWRSPVDSDIWSHSRSTVGAAGRVRDMKRYVAELHEDHHAAVRWVRDPEDYDIWHLEVTEGPA